MADLNMRELFLARNTVIQMLRDRGCDLNQETFETYDAFLSTFTTENPSACNLICSKENKSIAVHFTLPEKMQKKMIEQIITDYSSQNVSRLVLVVVNKLNHATLAYLTKLSIQVEIFLYKELLFNPTLHYLVPKQRIMAEDESQQLLKRLKCNKEDLPVMLKSDIIARYLGGEVEDIVEINRRSKTAGESKYYRVIKGV
ncbi:RPAB1 [Enterospora canceri]|uniref:DNA-directed RNA polymerases I, II, and III subunit RPABC1 n=1 Tax=Enterospora canceri TaxID=1081671 RepID=A0A1Y1S803_9MICR|nr:RPAB1 [Enterospora canceri]